MKNKEKYVEALILAGGLGTRMKSDKPKVLHEICGETLLKHVILNVEEAGVEDIGVVVGYKADLVKEVTGENYNYFLQSEQLGTGHAVMMARDFLKNKKGKILVLCGDAPLIDKDVINAFIDNAYEKDLDLCVLTAVLEDAKSYGRIVRTEGKLEKIVELKDADAEQKNIKEVNSGSYIFDIEKLEKHLDDLNTNNAQHEYYITDMIEIFKSNGYNVDAFAATNGNIVEAANNRYELSKCEELLRNKLNKQYMINGVTMVDPNAIYIDRGVMIGSDTVIYPGTVIKGDTKIGEKNVIYSSKIVDSTIGNGNVIDNSNITNVIIESEQNIGPYAVLK